MRVSLPVEPGVSLEKHSTVPVRLVRLRLTVTELRCGSRRGSLPPTALRLGLPGRGLVSLQVVGIVPLRTVRGRATKRLLD